MMAVGAALKGKVRGMGAGVVVVAWVPGWDDDASFLEGPAEVAGGEGEAEGLPMRVEGVALKGTVRGMAVGGVAAAQAPNSTTPQPP